jgi:UDP-N-acetyl-D-mannosaminouronate:lipid I N-acetyl-D-mannosaminouronosyltransferase
LMAEASIRQASVFLVGASAEVIKRTQIKLIEKYQTPIVGYQDGYFDDDLKLIEDIKVSGAKIITVAMGIPRQEQFIFKCRDAGINAIFMGVGGTYDVFTGNVKRAPLIWQNVGLEWLYRLLSQPTRWRRQVNLLRFVWLYMNKRL